MRVISDKRGKHTAEEKKRLDAIKRWDTKNSVTLLSRSDQSVQGCNEEIARIGKEKQKLQEDENVAKQALDPALSDEARRNAEMAITNANGRARQDFAHAEQTQRRNMTSASDGRRSNALGGATAPLSAPGTTERMSREYSTRHGQDETASKSTRGPCQLMAGI